MPISIIEDLISAGIKTLSDLVNCDVKKIQAQVEGLDGVLLKRKKKQAEGILKDITRCLEDLNETQGDTVLLSRVDEELLEKNKDSFVRRREFHRQKELLDMGLSYEDIDKAVGRLPIDVQISKINEVLDGARRRAIDDVRSQLEEENDDNQENGEIS